MLCRVVAVYVTGHPIYNDLVYGGRLFAENSHSCSRPGYKAQKPFSAADSDSDEHKDESVPSYDRADCIDCRRSQSSQRPTTHSAILSFTLCLFPTQPTCTC